MKWINSNQKFEMDTRFKPIQTFGLESMKAKLSFPLENPNLYSLLYIILMVLLIYSGVKAF